MKTKKAICPVLISIIAVVTFFSCENPLALGSKLDIEGPVVNILSPSRRASVKKTFDLIGTAEDKTGVDRMLITAKIDNKDFPRQWRYQNGAWQVSDNKGASWSPFAGGAWGGANTSVKWKITVDMDNISGFVPKEGEYTFTVQAWDKGDFTDDNSLKAVILILDLNPPKVDVTYPLLYRGPQPYIDNPDFNKLHDIPDNGLDKEYEEPAYLGKFITQEFDLKWQVEDMNDVWSIDLRLYKYDVEVDDDPETPLPDNYIYKYNLNIGAPPANVSPDKYIKPNGTITIPDLTSPAGNYYGGELKIPLPKPTDPDPGKTTIKIVAVSYDASGQKNQEKTIGYFIYWPRANNPWIIFPVTMNPPVYYPNSGSDIAALENTAYMVYPGKDIKATAYQAFGVKRIEYAVYSCKVDGAVAGGSKGNLTNALTPVAGYSGTITSQVQSTILAWSFQVPPLTGYYVVKATAFSFKEKPSKEYEMLFRINDITFPDFPTPIQPAASSPLYLAMDSNGTQFTISGTLSDATGIDSLCLVWINPESKDAAANAQLVYFRDQNYGGWNEAKTLSPSGAADAPYAQDGKYDSTFKNKLWKLNPVFQKIDEDTNRRIYTFSKVIKLSDLNIGANLQPLKSQMFLFRAENPVDKCTIITYAPQGDTVSPAIKVKDVIIRETSSQTSAQKGETCIPNQYNVIPTFAAGNSINITGKWREDSVAKLDRTTFFKNYFEIKVNNTVMEHLANQPALTLTPYGASDPERTDADGTWDGSWTLNTVVGNGAGQVPLSSLKDTLVIDAKTRDIGGNVAQIGNSWLIKSDRLQLMRISSEKPDDIYGTGEEIEIFLEFSLPVKLNERFTGNREDIQLILSTATGNTARARYRTSQTDPSKDQRDQNSRQYFVYTVGAGENTGNTAATEYLNVKGLYYPNYAGTTDGGVFSSTTAYTAANYPFAWSRGSSQTGSFEEVRLTMQTGKNGDTAEGTSPSQYFARTLPTSTNSTDNDYQFTLFSGKHIKIDTTLPRISSISTTTPAGYYREGDIYFTIKFSEDVKLGGATPQIPLNANGTILYSSADKDDVRVNGDSITFKYTIVSPISSGGKVIYVSENADYPILGDIYDIAGNKMSNAPSNNNLNNMSETNRSLTGVYVETQTPGSPAVRVFSTNYAAAQAIDNNVISQSVKASTTTAAVVNYGRSSASARDLDNVYSQNLYLAVQSNTTNDNSTTPYKCDYMEYSIDDGVNWIRVPNNANTPFSLERTGDYNIKARQVDKAGNKSAPTNAVNFTWDPGSLVTRVSSTSANGEYTHVEGRNKIEITLNFRKPLYFYLSTGTANPSITLNATNSAGAAKTVTTTRPTDQVSSLTFTYTVANGDKTPAGQNLKITGFSPGANVEVFDGNNIGVLVNSLLSPLPDLDATKEFTVATGALEFTSAAETTEFPGQPAFIADNYGGTGYDDTTSSNYHGIRTDDGSYWTTLRMTYNHEITKGDGSIIVKQIPGTGTGSYRLPAVMTETQYNRFKNVSVTVSGTTYNTDTFYVKGTNGYKFTSAADQGSDTSNKYILQYKYDPRGDITANNNGFDGNTFVPSQFIEAFRDAEAITIPVNSQAVTITNSGKTLNVRLSGSNAPQVPGAIYEVKLPAGLVNDSLGNESAEFTKSNVQLRGVAKPFVRIKKPHETIKAQTGTSDTPRLTVDKQPMLASARIDCRTPGSTITYNASIGQTAATGNPIAPGSFTPNEKSLNNWFYNAVPDDNTATNYNNNLPPAPNAQRPGNATATPYTNSNQITFGYVSGTTEPTIDNVQGFQWWVRARAGVGTTYSFETEEMAYRTVISYVIRRGYSEVPLTDGRSRFEDGDQAWIRGGDAIGSSSIPGFPFTWEDNWDNLKEKRAGIRLMTMVKAYPNYLTFTRNTGTNTYTLDGHGLQNGNTIYVNGNTTARYVVNRAANTIQIANTNNGTAQDFGDTIFVITSLTAPNTLNNSLWRFVTWEMNTTAYVDFIRGRDLTEGGLTLSSPDEAWQYGPRRWCYQVDGWTAFKDRYPIYAGKHRWCDMGSNMNQKGGMNFSGTFMARKSIAFDYPNGNK